MINALQLFGGMVGVAISGTIFSNKLRSGLALYAPGLESDLKDAVVASVSAIADVPPDLRDPVLHAYSNALGELEGSMSDLPCLLTSPSTGYVFVVGVPVGIIATLSSL